MLRYALPLFAATALATPLSAAEVQIQSTGPVVELRVTESVKTEPDMVNVGAGVTTEAQTAVEAMRLNARQMTAVIERIKALGIPADDIQTTGINLNAQYDYNRQTRRQVFRGYSVSNRVSVTLRNVEATGRVLDSLVQAGATDISGPNFSVEDDTAAKAQAREAAMETAKERAMEYAGWAGFTGIRLLEVSESVSVNRAMPVMREAPENAISLQATPVQPGLVSTGVTVTVKYEMTR